MSLAARVLFVFAALVMLSGPLWFAVAVSVFAAAALAIGLRWRGGA